jgi:hypothetical protein
MIANFTITAAAYRVGKPYFNFLVRDAMKTRIPCAGSFVNADTGVSKNYRENYPVFDHMPLDGCMDRGGSMASEF